MGKSSKNNLYDGKRALIVKKVSDEFGVSQSYVRMSISESTKRKSLNAEAIAKRYNQLRSKLEKSLA